MSKNKNLFLEKVAESNPPLYHPVDTGFVPKAEDKKHATN